MYLDKTLKKPPHFMIFLKSLYSNIIAVQFFRPIEIIIFFTCNLIGQSSERILKLCNFEFFDILEKSVYK